MHHPDKIQHSTVELVLVYAEAWDAQPELPVRKTGELRHMHGTLTPMEISHDYSKAQIAEIMHALIDREAKLSETIRDCSPGTDTHYSASKAHDRVRGLIDHFAERLVTTR